MIITFCGHADYTDRKEDEEKILAYLEEKVGDEPASMFLGGYGEFDLFAHRCCKKYQQTHPNIKLVLVKPYKTGVLIEDCKRKNAEFDEIYYPEMSGVMPRFAILYRNKVMVGMADYVIAYINRTSGGAYKAYAHAKKKGKEIYNLGTLTE